MFNIPLLGLLAFSLEQILPCQVALPRPSFTVLSLPVTFWTTLEHYTNLI